MSKDPAAQSDRKLLSFSVHVAREQEPIMIKRGKRMVKRGGGEKKNVGVKYFSAIIIFAPTRSRTGAFLSERDKHIQRAFSNDVTVLSMEFDMAL